jgi:hypothetical protein
MGNAGEDVAPEHAGDPDETGSGRSIEWYSQGQTRVITVGSVRVTVRFVGRKGRRARIAIAGPPGAVFHTAEGEPPGGTDEPNGSRRPLRS